MLKKIKINFQKTEPPVEEVIDEEAVRWVSNLLKAMGIPDAGAVTLKDLLEITDEEVEICFERIYGQKNDFNLSKIEKKCLYLIHKNTT